MWTPKPNIEDFRPWNPLWLYGNFWSIWKVTEIQVPKVLTGYTAKAENCWGTENSSMIRNYVCKCLCNSYLWHGICRLHCLCCPLSIPAQAHMISIITLTKSLNAIYKWKHCLFRPDSQLKWDVWRMSLYAIGSFIDFWKTCGKKDCIDCIWNLNYRSLAMYEIVKLLVLQGPWCCNDLNRIYVLKRL